MRLDQMSQSTREGIIEKAGPALVDLAKRLGIVAADLAKDQVLDTLRDLLDHVHPTREPTFPGASPSQPIGQEPIIRPDARFDTMLVDDAGAVRIGVLRSSFTLNGRTVEEACGPGRYRALALTALEEACMWAIKSVTHEPKA